LLLTVPAVASADSFDAYFAGTGRGTAVSGYNGSTSFSVWAGEIKWDGVGVPDFLSYCIQMDSNVAYHQVFSDALPQQISLQDATQIAYLVSKNFASITSDAGAAALQLAIWNVLYDSDYSISSGSFRSTTSAVLALGNSFLTDLQQYGSLGGSVNFFDAKLGQDQVTVPEPATLLLLGASAIVFGARRRFTRRA
jgi:hypothetical protein